MTIYSKEARKILITARNSYIGNSFAEWVSGRPEYSVDFITCRDDEWKKTSFAKYDVILHVAGIAHVEAKEDQSELYYKVNTDLTIDLARKAKVDGVKQFVFLSSMIVFGESNINNRNIVVTSDSKPEPSGFYGNSKLQGEKGIIKLQDEKFNIVIVRPPMIYGKGSKGNFPKLVKLAKISPIFPNIHNQRSVLYIDNLCEFLRLIIYHQEKGCFHPQNKEYVNITELVRIIAKANGKHLIVTKLFNSVINLSGRKLNFINKLFGTFIYDQSLSYYKENYWVRTLKDSVVATTQGEKKE
jgi:nucleoside-diphosphate-sugar epimerase